jgi:hypothetical protein
MILFSFISFFSSNNKEIIIQINDYNKHRIFRK